MLVAAGWLTNRIAQILFLGIGYVRISDNEHRDRRFVQGTALTDKKYFVVPRRAGIYFSRATRFHVRAR